MYAKSGTGLKVSELTWIICKCLLATKGLLGGVLDVYDLDDKCAECKLCNMDVAQLLWFVSNVALIGGRFLLNSCVSDNSMASLNGLKLKFRGGKPVL